AGRFARARELFEAAHDRLPADVAVTSHFAAALAATGDRARAIELVRARAGQSDDPEYAAQLAQLLQGEGRAAEADEQRARAAAERALSALARPGAHLRVLASRAFDACGRKDRAAAELRAVEGARR